MNVLIVSQCDKRALTESRRILDQFAERRGERCWQTAITHDGLTTLRRLLRKTARKNTAVACHWIRGLDRSELLWTVGDASRFNDEGAVPTNTTARNVLRVQDQNDWHTGGLIQALTDMSGLLHDLGKATDAFQLRLQGRLDGKNLIRHEWVSLRLLESFVGKDDDATWLQRLASPTGADPSAWLAGLHKDNPECANHSPFSTLGKAPLAQALGWLVLSHHRLPVLPDARYGTQRPSSLLEQALSRHLRAEWNEDAFLDKTRCSPLTLKPFWAFAQGLPVSTREWHQRAARVAKQLLPYAGTPGSAELMGNPFVLHLARMCLMLADHHYSKLGQVGGQAAGERIRIARPSALIANTLAPQVPNQPLDEHLVGVAQHGSEVARFLPQFEQHLPRLGRHRKLKQRADDRRFQWQNKAFELASGLRERSKQQGGFIINMASTGCGKTLANARVMYALADPSVGMRCAFAMGLRTLTLQTGRAFRDLLSLDEDELAIQVGGAASRALFEHHEHQAELNGSASSQDLLAEDVHVLFDGQHDQHPLLRRAVADPQVRKLLLAPLLVCTIDHLTPATESLRGGRQIAPMLRLLSGDLVLDEPDDFDLNDLPALTRLVHWAGLLGARVLLSSATLPPALVKGLFEAYRTGRACFQSNRGDRPNLPVAPCCLWIDEFNQQQAECGSSQAFDQAHQAFVRQRVQKLAESAQAPRRRVALVPLEALPRDEMAAAHAFATLVMSSAQSLHQAHHSVDPASGKRVSFGLVRMANIEPLVEVALALFQQGAAAGSQVHLCVYHSRFPLLIRSAIEQQLDSSLKRHQPEAVFTLPDIRSRLDASPQQDQIFIVLGSPVTEVGRDHDYDWAVVEPSSVRSLIQLLGRVRRHRDGDCGSTNVHVFSSNLRHFSKPGEAAFCRPGFEAGSGQFRLDSHDLRQLLTAAELEAMDARPRIAAPSDAELHAQTRLSHLEHARMQDQMLPQPPTSATPTTGRFARGPSRSAITRPELNASSWWACSPADALLTGLIPQAQKFRDDAGPQEVDLVLLPDDDDEVELAKLHWVLDTRQGPRAGKSYSEVESLHTRLEDRLLQGPGIAAWGVSDYMAELSALADALGMSSLRRCAERFGTVSVPEHQQGWRSHPVLGFTKRK
jgi:CRISPR-associated endonuclease/helicase Cas3